MERTDIASAVFIGLLGICLLTGAACVQGNNQANPFTCTPVLVAVPGQLSFAVQPGGALVMRQTISIVNKSTGTLNWILSDNSPWISLQRMSGTTDPAGTAVDVTVDAANLMPGQYTGVVTITSDGALNSPIHVPVMVSIGQPELPPAQLMPPQLPSSQVQPPTESSVLWQNTTSLYRYADSSACIVNGSITNVNDSFFMRDVQIVTKSGNATKISDSIAPREAVLYNRFIPCFGQEDVSLKYTWQQVGSVR
jgi:hypothetical protein